MSSANSIRSPNQGACSGSLLSREKREKSSSQSVCVAPGDADGWLTLVWLRLRFVLKQIFPPPHFDHAHDI